MKKIATVLVIIIILLVILSGCINDSIEISNNEPSNDRNNKDIPDNNNENIDDENNNNKRQNQDLSFSFKITDFELTKRVDILKWSQIYIELQIDDQDKIKFDNDGRFWYCWLNRKKNIDFEYTFDIPYDTKQENVNVKVDFFDYNIFLKDDHIDVTEDSDKTFYIKYDILKDSLSVNSKGNSIGSDATIWYEISIEGKKVDYGREYTYEWSYKNTDYILNLNIPDERYDFYKKLQTDSRAPKSKNDMKNFLTSNDEIITSLADKIDKLTDGFDKIEKINFILYFVQQIIDYKTDMENKGQEEYWSYPVEVLVERKGDCEDSSLLFASITKVLGFDTALLLYIIDEDENKLIGHLAVGIHLTEEVTGGKYVIDENSGKKYYYCETAYDIKNDHSPFVIGKIPNEVKDIYSNPHFFIKI